MRSASVGTENDHYRLAAKWGDDLGRVLDSRQHGARVRLWPSRDHSRCYAAAVGYEGTREALRLREVDLATGETAALFGCELTPSRDRGDLLAQELVAVQADARWCVACVPGGLTLFDAASRTTSSLPMDPAPTCVWSLPGDPDRALVRLDGRLHRVHVRTGALTPGPPGTRLLASSRDGSYLVTFVTRDGAVSELALCDLRRGTSLTVRTNIDAPRSLVAISSDGEALWCVNLGYHDDPEFEVLSTARGKRLARGRVPGRPIALAPVNAQSAWVLDASSACARFDAATLRRTVTADPRRGTFAEYATASLDHQRFYYVQGTRLAVTSTDGRTRRAFHRVHTGPVSTLVLSPDEALAVTLSHDPLVHAWNTATGELVWTLEGHSHRVTCAAFTPDGRTLWTCDGEEPSRAWDITTGTEITRGGEDWIGTLLTIAPDGVHALVTVDPSIDPEGCGLVLVNLNTLQRVEDLREIPGYRFESEDFSEDAREVLTCEWRPGAAPDEDPRWLVRRFAIDANTLVPRTEIELKPRATPHPRSTWSDGIPVFKQTDEGARLVVGWSFMSNEDDEGRGFPPREPSYRVDFHDPTTGFVARRVPSHDQWNAAIDWFDPNVKCWEARGNRLAVALLGGTVRTFAIDHGTLVGEFTLPHEEVTTLTLTRDARTLYLTTESGWVFRYDERP